MNHKEFRKFVKKFRRKKIRQERAQERDLKLEKEKADKLKDPQYQEWIKEQEAFQKTLQEADELKRQLAENLWLEREQQAQTKFKYEEERKKRIAEINKLEREKIQTEFEQLQKLEKKKQKEKAKLQKEIIAKQQDLLKKLNKFTEGIGDIPDEAKKNIESNPEKELCPFFMKTAACRHNQFCSKNHITPGISRMILLRNFFHHILLNDIKNTEYGNDILLEFTESELDKDYAEFFQDISSELEKFGKIINIRTSRNCLPHLRGNVYVEYNNERSAMKAYLNLQGRFYASKQVIIEFCNLLSWKSAICGLSLSKNCPKGKSCNYLHIIKNPNGKYNNSLNYNSLIENRNLNKQLELSHSSWNDIDKAGEKRNWRWSESPDRESYSNLHVNKIHQLISGDSKQETPSQSSSSSYSTTSKNNFLGDNKRNRNSSRNSKKKKFNENERRSKSKTSEKRNWTRSESTDRGSFSNINVNKIHEGKSNDSKRSTQSSSTSYTSKNNNNLLSNNNRNHNSNSHLKQKKHKKEKRSKSKKHKSERHRSSHSKSEVKYSKKYGHNRNKTKSRSK